MNCCTRITLWLIQKGYDVYDWFTAVKYEPVTKHISAAELPWVFVGVELTDGTLMDVTGKAEHLVNSGIPVTPTTISSSIDQQLVKRCFYLDVKTLKEEEIPADGITIE